MALKKKVKNSRKLERHFKGVANHTRIDILLLVAKSPQVTLVDITERLGGNFKTISEHTRKLVIAGLVEKSYAGRAVMHSLTPYGKIFLSFIQTFSNSAESESI